MEKGVGTVIRLTKLTESSLIVHWCTAEAGLIKTVAKGARRQKGAFSGKLDLFVEAELVWSPAKHGELHTLKEVDVFQFREGLRASYAQTLAATYFAQLIEVAVEPQSAVPEIEDLLKRGLGYLEKQADLRAVRHFEKELGRLLGVSAEGSDPSRAIAQHCGGLPRSRAELLKLL